MPVILTETAEWQEWLTLPWAEATALQRPLPGGTLKNTFPTKRIELLIGTLEMSRDTPVDQIE